MKVVNPHGDTIWVYYTNENGQQSKVYYSRGFLYNSDGSNYSGGDEFLAATLIDLNSIGEGELVTGLIY
ncbi:MAG: hypothetical protein LWX56_03645 [Ignavibacteria bacterium]|nr:hypothetical protein [Ignavibacteria bacterium]